MFKLLRLFYTIYCAVVFIALLIITLPFFFLFSWLLRDRALILLMYLCKIIAYGLGFLSGIYFIKHKNPKVDRNKAYVIIANHRSNMDAPVAAVACHGRVRYLAKKELLKVPLLGQLFNTTTVIVDRSSKESRRKSMEQLAAYLKKGDHIFIFPEGTRNKTKEIFIDFKDGAFSIAIQTQTPILPMLFVNSDNIMPNKPILMRPGLIRIYELDPVDVNGLKDTDVQKLKEEVRQKMAAKYEELTMSTRNEK